MYGAMYIKFLALKLNFCDYDRIALMLLLYVDGVVMYNYRASATSLEQAMTNDSNSTIQGQ